jgi:hypothetical protein
MVKAFAETLVSAEADPGDPRPAGYLRRGRAGWLADAAELVTVDYEDLPTVMTAPEWQARRR